jgi:hypothetical protein
MSGLACGYSDEDEITVGAAEPGARVTNYHVFAGDDGNGTVLWPPQARRDAWTLQLRAGSPPGPGPVPIPNPRPTPVPSPQTSACERCPEPKPFAGQTVRFRYKQHGQVCDTTATFYAKDGAFVDAGPFENWCFLAGVFNRDGSGALWCPARPEGHPDRIVCEDCGVGGRGPAWRCEPAGCEVHLTDNPWQASASNASALYVCTRDMAFCQNVYEPKRDDPGTECR